MTALLSNTTDLYLAKASIGGKRNKAGSKCIGMGSLRSSLRNSDVLEPAIQLGMPGNPRPGLFLEDSSFLVWGRWRSRRGAQTLYTSFSK